MKLSFKPTEPEYVLQNPEEIQLNGMKNTEHSTPTLHQLLTDLKIEKIPFPAQGWILAGYAFWIGSVVSAIMHFKVDMFYLAALGISSEILRQLCVQLRGARLAACTGDLDVSWLPALVELEAASNGDIQIACRLNIILILRNFPAPKHQLTNQTLARLRKKLLPSKALQNPQLASAVVIAHLKCRNADAISDAKSLRTFPVSWQLRKTINEYLKASSQFESLTSIMGTISPANSSRPETSEGKQVESNVEHSNLPEANLPNHGRHKLRHNVLAAAFIVFTPYGLYHLILNSREHHVMPAIGGLLLAVTPLLLTTVSITNKHIRDLKTLSNSDEMSSICPLVDALNWPEPYAKKLAISGLTRLLPRLKASDANLLNVPRRVILYQWLLSGSADEHEEFIITILKCLEQIGDAAAVKYVERLAYDTRPSPAQKRVQSAALVCLNYLHIIEGNTQNSTTLLRAADFNTTDTERLLRATSTELDNNNLLRSTTISE